MGLLKNEIKELFSFQLLTEAKKAVIIRSSRYGGVPEWLKGADCKSVGDRLLWFESTILHQNDIGNDVVFFIFSPFHFRLFPVAIPAGERKKWKKTDFTRWR